VIGRFYSNDPVGFSNVHNFNQYAYANNNSYKYTDPDGQEAKFIGNAYAQFKPAHTYIATNSKAGARIMSNLLSKNTPVVEISSTNGETKMTTATPDENAKIEWNPKEGVVTKSGTQSPATELVHEVIHAQNPDLTKNETVNK
jgi:hypothetical protein